MVTPIDLPVLFSQLPHLQQLQHQAQQGPQGSQNLLAEVVVKKQEDAKKKIFKTDKTQAQNKISPDKEQEKSDEQSFNSSASKKKSKQKEELALKDKGKLIDIQV